MFLVCHVISQDHMTKGWNNIMGRSTSSYQLAKSDGYRDCGSGYINIIILGCHVISEDHVMEGLRYFMRRNP